MTVLPTALALAAAATAGWACLESERPPAEVASRPQHAEPAREALVGACGTCHRSDLPTAKAGALAIFDLTQDVWWATLLEEHDEGLLRRVRGNDGIQDDGKAAVEAFIKELRPAREPG